MSVKKSDFDQITKGFLSYLEKSGQLSKLPHLAKEQIKASKTLFDPNLAIVQTVVKLEKKQISQLESKLEAIFKRPIKIINRLDKKILGGLVIRIGDQIIDYSLKSKIESVKENLCQ